jgi:hypothetical protein
MLPLTTVISRPQPRQTSFLYRILKERVLSNNPGSLEEMKHNIVQIAANTDHETLRKVARNALETMGAFLREGGEYFHHLL